MKTYEIVIEHYKGSHEIDVNLNSLENGISEEIETVRGLIKLNDILNTISHFKMNYAINGIIEIVYNNEYVVESEELIKI